MWLVFAALALGVAADALFNGRPFGLNVFLFAGCFVAGLAVLLRVGGAPLHQGRRWMAAPLLLFSAAFVWHDSRLLTAVNLLALAGAVALGGLRRGGDRPQEATVSEYAAGLAAAGSSCVVGAVALLGSEVPWQSAAGVLRSGRAVSVARGVAISLPVLALFGGLFFAADSVFAGYVSAAVPPLGNPLTHIVLIGLVAWLAAGLLRDLLARREEDRALSAEALLRRSLNLRLGATEVVIALTALDLLFLAFVAVQAGYLFGGRAVVDSHAQLTYAQYARHGFFELVVVSVLVLPTLLPPMPGRRRSICLLSALGCSSLLRLGAAAATRRAALWADGVASLRSGLAGCLCLWSTLTVLRAAQSARDRRVYCDRDAEHRQSGCTDRTHEPQGRMSTSLPGPAQRRRGRQRSPGTPRSLWPRNACSIAASTPAYRRQLASFNIRAGTRDPRSPYRR